MGAPVQLRCTAIGLCCWRCRWAMRDLGCSSHTPGAPQEPLQGGTLIAMPGSGGGRGVQDRSNPNSLCPQRHPRLALSPTPGGTRILSVLAFLPWVPIGLTWLLVGRGPLQVPGHHAPHPGTAGRPGGPASSPLLHIQTSSVYSGCQSDSQPRGCAPRASSFPENSKQDLGSQSMADDSDPGSVARVRIEGPLSLSLPPSSVPTLS